MKTPWFVMLDLDDNKGHLSSAKCAAAIAYIVCIALFAVSAVIELSAAKPLTTATLGYTFSLIGGSIAALFGRATFTAWIRQRSDRTNVDITADESERLDDDDRAA